MSVFVDTAVIMYAGGQEHELRDACRDVLGKAASGRLDAVTSAEVVQEILHRFTAIGQRGIGARMARYALDLFAPVLPVTHATMERMPALLERYEFLAARDLVHVATCLENGIGSIISTDRGFDAVGEIRRVAPGDAAGVDHP